ncbi:MAG: hemolysin family protein, partial [Myxococcales bacterium]
IGSGAIATELAGKIGTPYSVALATGVMTFLVLTFCEVIPKTMAKRNAASVAQGVGPVVLLLYYLLYPATWCLTRMTRAMMRLFGTDAQPMAPAVTGAEIEYLIDLGSRQGVLDDVKRQLLNSVLEFADLLVREIMVPRTRVIGIEKSASFEEIMKVVRDSEHSRIPVYEEELDNVVGILYVKDLARDLQNGQTAEGFVLERYVRPPFFVPELMKISRLLREFQKRKTHMAVVVDEFGGTSGVVTLEDVVEEIVGEIQDEYDTEEKPIKALPGPGGGFVADGAASLRDVEEVLGVEFPEEGDYETLGGFLAAVVGKMPTQGSVIVWGGFTFTVRVADERRIQKVEITKIKEKDKAAEGQPPRSSSDDVPKVLN